MKMHSRLKRITKWTAFPALILLLVSLVINSFVTNNAWQPSILASFLNTNTMIICICIGSSAVIISGGIDISLGALVSMCNVLLVSLMMHGVPGYLAVVIMLVVSVAAGAVNGILIAFLKVTPLLTTFAMSTVFSGVALIIMNSPGGSIAEELTELYYSTFAGIPMTVFIILILFVIWKIFKNTPAGVQLYAMGENENKSYLSGVNNKALQVFVYSFAGFSAGCGALAVTCMIGAGDPLVGSTAGMTAISAAVIGGVSLSGGRGDITGGIFASLFLGFLTNLIVALRFDAYSQQMLKAIILLAGVVLAVIVGRQNTAKKGGR